MCVPLYTSIYARHSCIGVIQATFITGDFHRMPLDGGASIGDPCYQPTVKML